MENVTDVLMTSSIGSYGVLASDRLNIGAVTKWVNSASLCIFAREELVEFVLRFPDRVGNDIRADGHRETQPAAFHLD